MPEISKNTSEKKVSIKKTRDKVWFKKEFSASALLFWIKGSVAVDYRFVRIVEQNTIFGLIPAGNHKQNIPLKNISDTSVNSYYNVKNFIWGIIIALIGFALFDSSTFFGLIAVLIGVGLFLNGIMTQLDIEKGGSSYIINVPFYNKNDVSEIQQAIEQALSADVDKTDQSLYHKRLNNDDIDNVQ
ncbi:hypothetical protein [Oenococcus oeni]|uniref:hypothetical protein n=1 Tax=Oenococcus oeni TaxID=1247 RepID=UPI0010BBC44E|nr:hypothetical protein [Oenococcus oeni]SYW09721.1 conserved hypothetical protein [Oenococcus oeni]